MSILRNIGTEDYVQLTPDEGDENLYMPMCGVSYCAKSYRVVRHHSPIYVFEYVCKGRGYVKVDGGEFEPEQGDVYLVHRGSDHEYGVDPSAPWVKIWFNVAGRVVDSLIRTYGLERTNFIPQPPLERIFRECLALVRDNPRTAHEVSTLAVHKLLFHLARAVTESTVEHTSDAVAMKRFMDSRVLENLTLSRISRHVHKSPSQAVRLFRAAWGVSPYQYFLGKKLEMAQVLLVNTRKPIKVIAAELHFADEYYFSNIFKRKTGICPRAYRLGITAHSAAH
jgi:AraC-like DNA-binding protein